MSLARAYWVARPGEGELREEELAAEPGPGRSVVRTELSGVSPGTERLVGLGRVAAEHSEAMACRYMQGDFGLPVKYGYCLIGRGEQGALAGERVFVMHPHQTRALVRDEHAVVLPAALPATRAALIPNAETALNAVWDAELRDGEAVVVVGAGLVGLLVAYVVWRETGRAPVVVEREGERREVANRLEWVSEARLPEDYSPGETGGAGPFAVAFHTTGSPTGLQVALDAVGFEGRVLELSWYGEEPISLRLGTAFHRLRKEIRSSQVGSVARSRRATHGAAGRLGAVLDLLDHPGLDALAGEPVPFSSMPEFMAELYRGLTPAPLPLIAYPA